MSRKGGTKRMKIKPKDVERIYSLEEQAQQLEDYAKMKNKERQVKKRIAEAKKSIRGDSFLDKISNFLGGNNASTTKSSKQRIRYDDVFSTEGPKQVFNEKLDINIPDKKQEKAATRPKKKKVSNKKFVKEKRKPLHEEVDDFILGNNFDNDDMNGLI